MTLPDYDRRTHSLIFHIALLLLLSAFVVNGQLYYANIRWCTVDDWELQKCHSFNQSLASNAAGFNFGFDAFSVQCVQAAGVAQCIEMVDQGSADIVTLDPGHVFTAGRFHSLVPIMQEMYSGGVDYYYAVAMVKRESSIRSLSQLRGSHACFPRVGDLAGWVRPITQLISKGVMEIADCNNHVLSVSEFFGQSCAVGSLMSRYNPLGDNSNRLCELCGSVSPTVRCTESDPYAGHYGALHCLVEKGDVAFVKHSLIDEVLDTTRRNGSSSPWGKSSSVLGHDAHKNVSLDPAQFELLCVDGTRVSLSQYSSCNWGRVPSHAIVTSSTKTTDERQRLQTLLQKAVRAYGVARQSRFSLFTSYQYGVRPNLMFQDATVSLKAFDRDEQLYTSYLGQSSDIIYSLNSCPIDKIVLCVTSLPELLKCIQLKDVLHSRMLKPDLECVSYPSQLACMLEIYRGNADITMMDAGDVYTAGYHFGLVPILSEVFETNRSHYYAVAVAKKLDLATDLLYLKNKMTCHSGMMHGAGWVVPMAYLVSNERIRGYGCDSVRAAGQAFTKSCVPGAMKRYYWTGQQQYNMCQLCHGSGQNYCARNAHEQFFGHTGAFRCLVEGGGDVAFVKHTTVAENTGGKRKQFWARNQLAADYQLLCRDGKRAEVDDFARCHVGRVRSNALITRGGSRRNDTEISTIVNLFRHAQQYFGQKIGGPSFNFRMFHSDEPHADLIFSDATHQLLPVARDEQNYRDYLGEEFLHARAVVDCTAGVTGLSPVSAAFTVIVTVLTSLFAAV